MLYDRKNGTTTVRLVPRPANLTAETRRDRYVIRQQPTTPLDITIRWANLFVIAGICAFCGWVIVTLAFML